MSYFYADGVDKAGNRLLTSYGKQEQARRYRPGSTITQGEQFLQINDDGTAQLSNEGTLLVRTLMAKPVGAEERMSGKFVVYARVNGQWRPTEFCYPNYAAANAAVKGALINLYGACAVVEETASSSAESLESVF